MPCRQPGSYDQAVKAAQTNPDVVRAMGAPIKVDWWQPPHGRNSPLLGRLLFGGLPYFDPRLPEKWGTLGALQVHGKYLLLRWDLDAQLRCDRLQKRRSPYLGREIDSRDPPARLAHEVHGHPDRDLAASGRRAGPQPGPHRLAPPSHGGLAFTRASGAPTLVPDTVWAYTDYTYDPNHPHAASAHSTGGSTAMTKMAT